MPPLAAHRIRHIVAFTPRHEPGSEGERQLLEAFAGLAAVPGVEEFELLREVSPKNGFRFAASMEFTDRAAYAAYDADPRHRAFVEERWAAEVADFFETDLAATE